MNNDNFKENLVVKEFSLKRIIENSSKIPNNGRFGDDIKKLTPDEKKKLMEMVAKYNEYGNVLRCEQALMETSKTLQEIAKMAETYAVTESSDWFQSKVVERDFKQVRGISENFNKLAKECFGKMQQLNALYEDMGHVLGRYYEIQTMQEVAQTSTLDSTNPSTPMEEKLVDEVEEDVDVVAPVRTNPTVQTTRVS